jgi:hypothetical protein
MANMNIGTPRFYPDGIAYYITRGSSPLAIVTGSNLLDFQTGKIGELSDGRPLNQVDFDTSSDSGQDHVLFTGNFGSTSYRSNYIAILNHNLQTCAGKIRIGFGNAVSDVNDVDLGSVDTTSTLAASEVVNADSITVASNQILVDPATDGTTLLTYTYNDPAEDVSNSYIGIQFEGNNGQTNAGAGDGVFTADLKIGGIMVGEYFDMPHAPDLSVKRSIIYDKVKIQESAGGQRYGIASNLGRTGTTTTLSPFNTGTYGAYTMGGRMAYDMNFSYLASTDVMPNEYDYREWADDAVVLDVWNATNGPHIPFIFSVDNSSTGDNAESEHIYARFAQNNLDMTQVAHNVWNVKMRIEEEF